MPPEIPPPESLRLIQQDADTKCGAVSLAFQRGDISEPDFWYWLAEYQERWTNAARVLAGWGL